MGLWKQIDADFMKKRGIVMPDDYQGAIMTMNLYEAAVYTIERFGLREAAADIVSEWKAMVAYAYKNTVRMKPYAKEYIQRMYECGAKMAIATSLSSDLYEPALNAHGIARFFHACCSTAEVPHGKSHPDVFLLAAQKLGTPPADCVVYEDLLIAVKSAKSAGMAVYGVYDESSRGDWAQIIKEADYAFLDFRDAPPFSTP